MFQRTVNIGSAIAVAVALSLSPGAATKADQAKPVASAEGIVKVRSAYSMAETVARLKQDIASKGIMFFSLVDRSKLAADAGIKLRPSSLLIFGNPPLGSLFMTSNPIAGLDCPVRLLVIEDEQHQVWAVYTDFTYIAHHHHIADRNEAFNKASMVIASITASVQAK